MSVTLAAWHRLWRELGAPQGDEALFHQLVAAYSEKHRRYHTLQHLRECLAHFEGARELAPQPAEVELALWMHDAVYDVHAKDNEERSADWAVAAARQGGLAPDVGDRLHALVMATKHTALPQAADAKLLVDADLAILGAPVERFDESDAQIREEYIHVPMADFKRGRCEILRSFLARPSIYATDGFRTRFEAQARSNIQRAIQNLSSRA